jgi:hypothetical protein
MRIPSRSRVWVSAGSSRERPRPRSPAPRLAGMLRAAENAPDKENYASSGLKGCQQVFFPCVISKISGPLGVPVTLRREPNFQPAPAAPALPSDRRSRISGEVCVFRHEIANVAKYLFCFVKNMA